MQAIHPTSAFSRPQKLGGRRGKVNANVRSKHDRYGQLPFAEK
jgi:hypothetical protein